MTTDARNPIAKSPAGRDDRGRPVFDEGVGDDAESEDD